MTYSPDDAVYGPLGLFLDWLLLTYLTLRIVIRMDRLTVLPGALRAWRKERGISQETLAKHVGVTPGMIALIETGRRQPGADLLDRIAADLGVTSDAIAFVPEPLAVPA